MLGLTDFVLHCACRQLAAWQAIAPAGRQLSINVNVSGHDIAHAPFVARVSRALVEAQLQPAQLCLELTEGESSERSVRPVVDHRQLVGLRLRVRAKEVPHLHFVAPMQNRP